MKSHDRNNELSKSENHKKISATKTLNNLENNEVTQNSDDCFDDTQKFNKSSSSVLSFCDIITSSQSMEKREKGENVQSKVLTTLHKVNAKKIKRLPLEKIMDNFDYNTNYIFLNKENCNHKCQIYTNVIVHQQNCNLVKCQETRKFNLKRKATENKVRSQKSNRPVTKNCSNYNKDKHVILKSSDVSALELTEQSTLETDFQIINSDAKPIECNNTCHDMNAKPVLSSSIKCDNLQISKPHCVNRSHQCHREVSSKANKKISLTTPNVKLTNSVVKNVIPLRITEDNCLNEPSVQAKLECVHSIPGKIRLCSARCISNFIISGKFASIFHEIL